MGNTDINLRAEEALKNAMLYFNGDRLACDVWLSKYALRDKDGTLIEIHPIATNKRMARTLIQYISSKGLSRKERFKVQTSMYDVLLSTLNSKYFLFGGSVLFGLGNDFVYSSLGNCFVIHTPVDSYGGIMKTDEEQIQLMKRRGGVGHDISHLRSKGSLVNNAAKTSTGAVSFMHRFSNSTREVAQEGRRGALMLTMESTHPDILDFISAKADTTKITGANISVKAMKGFMDAEPGSPENLILRAIAEQAWKTGEPGLLFWDTVQQNSPADMYPEFKSVSTNPCKHTAPILSN